MRASTGAGAGEACATKRMRSEVLVRQGSQAWALRRYREKQRSRTLVSPATVKRSIETEDDAHEQVTTSQKR